MPFTIKEHLFHMERMVLLYNAWEDWQILPNMIKNFFCDKKSSENKNNLYQETLCKRIFYHTALRVYEICRGLELKEDIAEKLWDTLKYIFENEPEIFQNRFIDQIIICSIYAVYKTNRSMFSEEI